MILCFISHFLVKMARGQQKIESQQKNAEKSAKSKKGGLADQKKSAAAALIFTCSVCKVISNEMKTCILLYIDLLK